MCKIRHTSNSNVHWLSAKTLYTVVSNTVGGNWLTFILANVYEYIYQKINTNISSEYKQKDIYQNINTNGTNVYKSTLPVSLKSPDGCLLKSTNLDTS